MWQPHRGSLILTLGILSFCFNPMMAMSIAAVIMGWIDLSAMKKGQMDPAGHGQTQTGFILGIVSLSLFGLVLLLYIGFVIAMVASGEFK
jgi:hypothetical protein